MTENNPIDIKIAYIGGGSRYWARMVMTDLALCPHLTGEIALYDIDRAAALRRLRNQGIAFLFVSHKLNEVMEISERVIAMRNGRKVSEGEVGEYNQARLVLELTGHEIGEKSYSFTPDPNRQPVLRVVLSLIHIYEPTRPY
mgnify:CR=1 FL=1